MSSSESQAPSTSTATVVETVPQEVQGQPPVLHLQQQAPDSQGVRWATDVVDNEHMDKKKSKCCCIYKKRRNWDESSDSGDSECETEHCRGHTEAKHKHH